MNIKTTVALLILVGSGVGLVLSGLALPGFLTPAGLKQPEPAADTDSRQVLEELKPDDFTRIEVIRSKPRIEATISAAALAIAAAPRTPADSALAVRVARAPIIPAATLLTRTSDGSWVMPGNWPTRPAEVRSLRELLGNLRSRFLPIPLEGKSLKDLGLEDPAVTVVVKTPKGEHRLAFDDSASKDSTSFDRPTFLRLDDKAEVLRLPPGLVAILDRPADYYQQRRLFPSERVPREEGAAERVDRLAGKRLEVREKGELKFAIVKGSDGWELSYPSRDALDPRTRDSLLEAVPEIWAERFLTEEQAKSSDTGLKEPDRVLAVTRPDGRVVTLEIGKPALEETPRNWNYARLKGFERVFEIDSDKLNNIFVPAYTLRDNQIARFKSEDAREVEITTARGRVVLRNSAPPRKPTDTAPPKSDWQMVEPTKTAAESSLVDRLLTTLSGLSALEKDKPQTEAAARAAAFAVATARLSPADCGLTAAVTNWLLDPVRLEKSSGLVPAAATVKVTVEEGKEEKKKKRTVTVRVGRHDRIGKKLFVRGQDWPRINETDDALAELVLDKSAVDYRGKRLLDFPSLDVDRLTVRRFDLAAFSTGWIGLIGGMPDFSKLAAVAALAGDRTMEVALARTSDGWSLTAPVKATADSAKVDDLVGRLSKLDVATFAADKATPAELQKKYGLGVPALSVTVSFSDKKKPARTIHVGKPHPFGLGYFARLEGAPEVFVLGHDLYGLLDRDSLAYRQRTLWQVDADDEIVKLNIHKSGQDPYQLVRKGEEWQVSGPFTVTAPAAVVDKLTAALRSPKAEQYLVHESKEPAAFGLDKPEVKVTLTTKKGKEHSLLVGRDSEAGSGKVARLASGQSVFVVGDVLAKTVDQSALDFLDRNILKFDSSAVTSIARQSGGDSLELVKKEDAWEMVKPSMQRADEKKVPDLLKDLGELKAARIAAYGPKDITPYGLDKPVTVTIKFGSDTKPAEYVLEVGKETEPGAQERFARVKGSLAVAVLPAGVVKKLLAGPLVYRDHSLARVPDADSIKLEAGERKVTFAKPEGSWKVTQPLSADADHDALEGFLNVLARLRADELVSDKPSQEQLKEYGLDKPAARWQFLSGDKVELDLLIGGAEKGGPRRYAKMAGKDLVFLLDPKLSSQVWTEYRPRTVFKDNVDPAQIESVRFGYRKDPFELKKVGGQWEVVGKPDARVNAAAVTDALSVLRDLKLERYVVDKGAQLKLYGLDPTELVLEVTTPTGTHTLDIGGLEGASKRRYARLPVKGQTDVFVLDVVTSSKLVRPLAAFIQDGK
jgi:hypothetical protein